MTYQTVGNDHLSPLFIGVSGRHNIATIVANNIATILEATIEGKNRKKMFMEREIEKFKTSQKESNTIQSFYSGKNERIC